MIIKNEVKTCIPTMSSEELKKQMTAEQYQKAQKEFFELRKMFHEKYLSLDVQGDKELIELLKIKICYNILSGGF